MKDARIVRKEIWTHVLAYNFIRTIIAQAASRAASLVQCQVRCLLGRSCC